MNPVKEYSLFTMDHLQIKAGRYLVWIDDSDLVKDVETDGESILDLWVGFRSEMAEDFVTRMSIIVDSYDREARKRGNRLYQRLHEAIGLIVPSWRPEERSEYLHNVPFLLEINEQGQIADFIALHSTPIVRH